MRRPLALAALASALAACTLLVSTDDLSDGASPPAPKPDATPDADAPHDAGLDTAREAEVDAGPTYRDIVLSDAPLSYWRFEETSGAMIAKDERGAHDGTYKGDFTLGAPGAMPGSAAMELTSGGVDIAAVYDFEGRAPYSVEAWVDPKAIDSAYRNVYSKSTSDNGPRTGHFLWLRASEGIAAERNLSWSSDGGTQESVGFQLGVPLNTWSHVVVTYDGTDMRLYVNGLAVGVHGSTASLTTTPALFRIGSGADLGGPWIGLLDEVAVYGAALSAERIAAHYHAAGR